MKKLTSLGTHWLMLLITAVLFGVVGFLVDLRPVVDENFFFSTSDPQFRPAGAGGVAGMTGSA